MLANFLRGGTDPMEFLRGLLLSLPAFLLALSLHEAAHAYVAYRCGDDTARRMGRMTINPIKHVDPIGFAMLAFVGVGWAKPVPVDPRNFKNPRRDDLLVSLAGITANLMQFVVGCVALAAILGAALNQLTAVDRAVFATYGINIVQAAFFSSQAIIDALIAPVLGTTMGFVYQMVYSYTTINIILAVFNLLPMPPLDGYHVLNNLVLKRPLSIRTMQIGQIVLIVLVVTGWLSQGLSYVLVFMMGNAGRLVDAVFHAMKLL